MLGLLALWLATRALRDDGVAEPEVTALEQTATQNLEAMQSQLAADIAGRSTSEAQQRMDSPRGQALFRRCAEWTDFHEQHPGEDARRQRDAACARLRQYVETGIDAPQD
jgi:hypothetical protein